MMSRIGVKKLVIVSINTNDKFVIQEFLEQRI